MEEMFPSLSDRGLRLKNFEWIFGSLALMPQPTTQNVVALRLICVGSFPSGLTITLIISFFTPSAAIAAEWQYLNATENGNALCFIGGHCPPYSDA